MKKTETGKLQPEDARVCRICGRLITGEYDYVRTRRHTELYFHKGMNCRRDKDGRKEEHYQEHPQRVCAME